MAGKAKSRRASLRERALASGFEALYHSRTLYWLASTIPFAGQWRVWQRRVLPRLVGRDVLEVGCGIGTLLADMVAAGYHCRAVDASPQMVAAARRELRRRGLEQRDVQVSQAHVQQLAFPDASFDCVVSTFPTPYIYDRGAIREIARVLRPGGRLIVVEAATLLPGNLLVLPFVVLQALAYGNSVRQSLSRTGHLASSPSHNAIETEESQLRRRAIPLESAGLARREQRDRSHIWEVSIVIGEKPGVLAHAGAPTASM